jgi:predicted RNA-binding Zn-ribbon protein involved in translation (DUF1610 family)
VKLVSPATEAPTANNKNENQNNVEEIDLTELDEKSKDNNGKSANDNKIEDKQSNIIDIQDILESEDKVEMDSSIKREVLEDEDELSKICPMCGEDMQINKKLLESTPVMVKCLKCGNETKIW